MKKILMSMRTTEANGYCERRSSIAYDYIEFFEQLGYLIILIPNNTLNIKKYFDSNVEMVVLSGGNNVNPKLYSDNSILDDIYDERDNTECNITDIALDKKIPILGICRGFHFLNVYLGGSINHSIKNHVNVLHELVSDINLLDNVEANSFHNQGVSLDTLSSSVEVIAKTKDSYIEAFIDRDRQILGVQWHPERQKKSYDIELITKFLEGKI